MKTLQGTTFLCVDCANVKKTTRFRCGSLGLDPLRERVVEHANTEHHSTFRPVNTKPGTFYVVAGTKNQIGPVFSDGADEEDWFKEVVLEGYRQGVSIEPSWELSNDSSK